MAKKKELTPEVSLEEEIEKTEAVASASSADSSIVSESEDLRPSKEELFGEVVSSSMARSSKEPRWYVVHTYSGHENKVKANIEKLVENRGMQDLILKIIVPTEERVEYKDNQRRLKTRKIFPGYVMIKMIVTNESWYLVRNTQGVAGFVGHGSEPIPLTDEEIRRMGIEKTVIVLDINVGDTVKVISGPFKGFMSVVEDVNVDKQTLKARVSMFGRDTLVELEYDQVDKI